MIIAHLKAQNRATSQAFAHSHNDLYLDSEPAVTIEDTACPLPGQFASLTLDFDHPPWDGLQGYVFGSIEADEVDILLLTEGVSRQHFRIDFNWENGQLLLVDQSSNGTIISSTMHGSYECKDSHFPLHNRDLIRCGVLVIEIVIPSRPGQEDEYNAEYEAAKKAAQEASLVPVSGLARLHLKMPLRKTMIPSGKVIPQEVIGCGSTGVVRKAFDAEGYFYAVKQIAVQATEAYQAILNNRLLEERDLLIRLKHVYWPLHFVQATLTGFQRNIVTVFNRKFAISGDPAIVMEYAQYKSLDRQKDLSTTDIGAAVKDILSGLSYLHAQDIVHRDIKPANILVICRKPIFVKLGDFGFTRICEDECTSFLGTDQYAAPEILKGQSYSMAVDMWAVGATVLTYSLFPGLPEQNARLDVKWAEKLSRTSWDSRPGWDKLTAFAQSVMDLDPSGRPSAVECLERLPPPVPAIAADEQQQINLQFLKLCKIRAFPKGLGILYKLVQAMNADGNRQPAIAIDVMQLGRMQKIDCSVIDQGLRSLQPRPRYSYRDGIYLSLEHAEELIRFCGGDVSAQVNQLQKAFCTAHLALSYI